MKGIAKDSGDLPREFDGEAVYRGVAAAEAALGEMSPELLQELLERRAAQLAEVPVREDEGGRVALVLIQLGRELYGLDVQHVSDLRPVEQITRVPRVPDWVAGVVNLRGRLLSVLDLQRFFGLPDAKRDEDDAPAGASYLLAVETPGIEVALLADDVLAVESLPANQVQEATGTVRGVRPEYVRGVAERGGDGDGPMLVVLDLPTMLTDERLIVQQEIV
jgi:purine-binding chemotaxis protein CheW